MGPELMRKDIPDKGSKATDQTWWGQVLEREAEVVY